MKRIIYTALMALVAMPAFSQLDRSIRPEAGPAREPEIADYKEYTLDNGMTLIVVENHKLPRVSIQLSLDIDPMVEGDKAGMVSMAGDLLREGTASRTKEQLDEEVDFMGANLSTFSSGAYASGLSKYSETLMELMADVVMNPAFPQEAFDKIKQQNLSALAANANDPGALISNLYSAQIYGLDHAFGEMMTKETVENVSLEDCRNYWSTYFKPNVAYMAIVGDIKPREAKKLVEEYFENWQRGEVPAHSVAVPDLAPTNYVALLDRPTSVQSEIRIGNRVVLKNGDSDLEAARLANQILGGGSLARLYLNLREDKGYTYGAYSSLGTSEYVARFTASAAVRNEVTDSAVAAFLFEINRMRTELVSDEELQNAKNYLAGQFGRSLESAQTVANFGLNIERFGLDEDYYNEYLQRLQAVTAEDVRAAAQKYFAEGNLTIAIVGKGADIAAGLEQFGEVRRFDRFGQPASDAQPVPADLTAEAVLDNYFNAVGGREAMEAVTAYKSVASGEVQGMTLTIEERWMTGDKYRMDIKLPVMSQTILVNGDVVKMVANGTEQPIPDEAKAEIKSGAVVFDLLNMSETTTVNLLPEVADVDGQSAYALEVTEGSGSTATHFFSVETGLRIRVSETQEGPQGEVVVNRDILEYTDADGIKVPSKYTFPLGGGMSVELNVSSVSTNATDLSESDFTL